MKKTNKIPLFVKGIFLIIALFFSFGIYLSLPVLFNYKSIENIIEKKFYSDFNIDLKINGDIKYQLLPKPHLLISSSSLSLDRYIDESTIIDIEKLKIFINTNNLYPKSNLTFEKFEVQEHNFLLKKKEYNALRNFFHSSKSKPIHINKSKIFILDEEGETLIISPLKKLVYITSKKDNFKKLNLDGNIFDLNFKSRWKKEFNSKFKSLIEVDFKDPNILLKNKFNNYDGSNFKGSLLINFLNQTVDIDYQLVNNIISLKSPKNNNNLQLDATIELKPFFFNSNIILNRQNLNFLIDELIFSILNLTSDLIGNLDGNFQFTLTNIKHELIRDGYVSFNFSDKSIKINEVLFNLGDIGIIESKVNYLEDNGEIVFNSSNTLTIKNSKNFAKKFQLNPNKVKHLKKIYFKIKKNINTGVITIFDIKINQLNYKDLKKKELQYNIKNSQELKALVKRIIND